jgi:hypothetical protein
MVDALGSDRVCSPVPSTDSLPNVIHFCQRYGIGRYFFGKRRLPGDFLSCASPLLVEPPPSVANDFDYLVFPEGKRKELTKSDALQNAFVVCNLIRIVNAAATYWKSQHCTTPENSPNLSKSLMLVDVKDYHGGR